MKLLPELEILPEGSKGVARRNLKILNDTWDAKKKDRDFYNPSFEFEALEASISFWKHVLRKSDKPLTNKQLFRETMDEIYG